MSKSAFLPDSTAIDHLSEDALQARKPDLRPSFAARLTPRPPIVE